MTTSYGGYFFPSEIVDDCGLSQTEGRLLPTAPQPKLTLTCFSFTPSSSHRL